MRTLSGGAIVREVDQPHHLDVRLRLDGCDPAFGSVEDRGGTIHPFWGWVELIELLQRLSAQPAGDHDAAGDR